MKPARGPIFGRILVLAVFVTLVATTIAPDVLLPFRLSTGESPRVARAEERLFNAIARPPQVVAESAGIWIDGHSAQVWPAGWPAFAAFALRLSLISIPFWFLAGVVLFEIGGALDRLIRRAVSKGKGHETVSRESLV